MIRKCSCHLCTKAQRRCVPLHTTLSAGSAQTKSHDSSYVHIRDEDDIPFPKSKRLPPQLPDIMKSVDAARWQTWPRPTFRYLLLPPNSEWADVFLKLSTFDRFSMMYGCFYSRDHLIPSLMSWWALQILLVLFIFHTVGLWSTQLRVQCPTFQLQLLLEPQLHSGSKYCSMWWL